ncbi:MAG: NYN domain-containing protein [Bacteroidia bacterium]|nr:NYN domain-containing protein [Bacteroidia bacterium]
MIKAMLFIDGSWLYHVRPYLLNLDGKPDFEIDYKALPMLVKDHLQGQMNAEVDLVRTNYFGTIAVNKPGHDNQRERQFYEMLNKRCFYNTEIYEFDFRNRESGRKENCLETGLTSVALFHAFQTGVFEVACLLAGDIDYQPLLKHLRLLGKRTMLLGVRGSNGFYPTHPRLLEEANLFDFPPLFLDDHLKKLQYQRVEQIRTCDNCGKEEATTFTSEWFYCRNCRDEHRQMRTRQNLET